MIFAISLAQLSQAILRLGALELNHFRIEMMLTQILLVHSELNIRHFTEGRMKCQAFVSFPSEELAEKALAQAHGVILHSKPLVVVRPIV